MAWGEEGGEGAEPQEQVLLGVTLDGKEDTLARRRPRHPPGDREALRHWSARLRPSQASWRVGRRQQGAGQQV